MHVSISQRTFRPAQRLRKRSPRRVTARPLTLRDLTAQLKELGGVPNPHQLQTWLRELRPTVEELAPFVQFKASAYRRNLVFRHENFEIFILCWRPGQHSPIHDHHGSQCGVLVLSGQATEVRFDHLPDGLLRASSIQQLPAGSVTSSADNDLHVVGNWVNPEKDLVTLHVYSPPLKDMQKYPDAVVIPARAHEIVHLEPPRVERLAMAHLTRIGEVAA